MSQVIMIFLFPIGFYFYFFVERKNKPKYQKIFDDFQLKVQNDARLSDKEKTEQYTNMLRHNGYTIVDTSPSMIKGEKRLLSMSLLAMSIGAYYVGVLVYLAYYFWLQKPHSVEYNVYRVE